jgi:hypothetical protein
MYRLHAGVYGPSKPSSLPSTEGGFTLIASMVALGEKLGTDQRIDQPACYGLCREPFFSGAVALSIVVDDFVKGCHMCGLPAESVRGGVCRLAREAYISC